MSKLWCYFVFLGWISYLLTAALLIYVDGFFLTRVARVERSDCVSCESASPSCAAQVIFKNPKSSSICLEPRSRVVLLVVDALKYEFLEWSEDAAPSFHRNKLRVVRDLLTQRPENTRLYKFVADPPTTTMQRLKGLMTGTLPTFIDVGSNFATERIDEDNLIEQSAKRGSVVFMGDDTWTLLFPGKFLRQFPAPSFNVWDLDTVDREVRSRIAFEMKKSDWSLLVAHTLGVDHCGHKHGQRHPEMARKLADTDRLIREVVEALDEDTVLFVLGDHGMTESGDHGGDSDDELQAGMFVYSKIPLLPGGDREDMNRVNQIDLVPTLAAILGIPIPFSNIGTVIVDSLPSSSGVNGSRDSPWFASHAMWRNVAQAKSYVDAYSRDSFLFSPEKLEKISALFEELKAEASLVSDAKSSESFILHSRSFLKYIRDLCAEIWVQFDAGLMSKGLVLFFCVLFFVYLLISGVPEDRMSRIMESYFLRFVVGANAATSATVYLLNSLQLINDFKNTNFFATSVISLALLVIVVLQNWDSISSTWYNGVRRKALNYLPRGILLLTFCVLFSNSYVVEEDKVLSFLLVTMIALLIYSAADDENPPILEDRKSKNGKYSINPRKSRGLLLAVGLVACAAVRLSGYFWRCREEQDKESCAILAGKGGTNNPEGAERALLTGSLILLALYITIVRIWLRNCGNLSGFSPSITVARYCPGVIVVCIGCYWVLQRLPKDAKVKLAVSWQVNALPGIVYFFISLGVFVLFFKPLGVYLLPRRGEAISVYQGEDIVPRLFDRVKELFYTKKAKEEPEVPVVYGLGTVYSAAFVSLSVFITLLWSLLLGNALAPGTFMMFVTCTAVLGIVALERFRNANSVAELLQIPGPAVLCWFLIAEYFFYGTGHQPTFPTIHWDAAFIGTGGHFYGNVLPAILIGINTFGGHLIMALTLPLLAVVPFTVYVMMPELAKLKFRVDDDMRKGELVLFERDSIFHNALFSIYGKYILIHGIRTFGCMLTTTIHCRHLMVWKIFAPKLIFEGLSFLVSLGSILASAFLVLRIDRQVDDLISRVITKTRCKVSSRHFYDMNVNTAALFQ